MLWRRSERLSPAGPAHAEIVETTPDPAELQAAYERGRRDERRGRRRHPVLMTLTFAAAAVGTIVLVMAAMQGSFREGGARVDRNLEIAADRATPVVKGAVADAGQAVQDAGRDLKAKAAEPAN